MGSFDQSQTRLTLKGSYAEEVKIATCHMPIRNVTCQSGTTHAVSLFLNGFQVVNQHRAREMRTNVLQNLYRFFFPVSKLIIILLLSTRRKYHIRGQFCRLVPSHLVHDGELFPRAQPRLKAECEMYTQNT